MMRVAMLAITALAEAHQTDLPAFLLAVPLLLARGRSLELRIRASDTRSERFKCYTPSREESFA
jgi:hypothetical protein